MSGSKHNMAMRLVEMICLGILVTVLSRASALCKGATMDNTSKNRSQKHLSSDDHYNLAYKLLKAGKFGEATAEFRKAIALNPNEFDSHLGLGRCLELSGQSDQAIDEYRIAAKLKPDYVEGHYNLGNLLARDKDPKSRREAVQQLEHALNLNPNHVGSRVCLGIILSMEGSIDSAIKEFRKAIELEPNNLAAHQNLGIALQIAGHQDEAQREFELAKKIK